MQFIYLVSRDFVHIVDVHVSTSRQQNRRQWAAVFLYEPSQAHLLFRPAQSWALHNLHVTATTTNSYAANFKILP